MIQYFHWYTEGDGKLWEEVQQNAEYLAELGITMVCYHLLTKLMVADFLWVMIL